MRRTHHRPDLLMIYTGRPQTLSKRSGMLKEPWDQEMPNTPQSSPLVLCTSQSSCGFGVCRQLLPWILGMYRRYFINLCFPNLQCSTNVCWIKNKSDRAHMGSHWYDGSLCRPHKQRIKSLWSMRLTKLPKCYSVFSLAPIFSKLQDHQIPDLRLHDHRTQLQAKN